MSSFSLKSTSFDRYTSSSTSTATSPPYPRKIDVGSNSLSPQGTKKTDIIGNQILLKRETRNTASPPISHSSRGAEYGKEGSMAYVMNPTCFDRQYFLDPCFLPFLDGSAQSTLLDAGCGPAHWAIRAAQHGAKVYGIDINEKMINTAKEQICTLGLTNEVKVEVGDVAELPYASHIFDRAISINVACNLPSSSVYSHFKEMHRVLKNGSEAIVTVPTSLGTVFSNGSKEDDFTFKHINEVLNELEDNPSPSRIYSGLMKLEEVINATFIVKGGRLTLITDIQQLTIGQKIWRKLPVLVVPNYYHPESEYLAVLDQIGFEVQKITRPHFINETQRLKYNKTADAQTRFGAAYSKQAAYAVYYLKKR